MKVRPLALTYWVIHWSWQCIFRYQWHWFWIYRPLSTAFGHSHRSYAAHNLEIEFILSYVLRVTGTLHCDYSTWWNNVDLPSGSLNHLSFKKIYNLLDPSIFIRLKIFNPVNAPEWTLKHCIYDLFHFFVRLFYSKIILFHPYIRSFHMDHTRRPILANIFLR